MPGARRTTAVSRSNSLLPMVACAMAARYTEKLPTGSARFDDRGRRRGFRACDDAAMLHLLYLVGVAAFAASGVLAAYRANMDPFGGLVLAFAASVSGGTLRDTIL